MIITYNLSITRVVTPFLLCNNRSSYVFMWNIINPIVGLSQKSKFLSLLAQSLLSSFLNRIHFISNIKHTTLQYFPKIYFYSPRLQGLKPQSLRLIFSSQSRGFGCKVERKQAITGFFILQKFLLA